MSKTKIYHNPRCSKSRQTLALLEEKGEDLEVIEYLKNPPSPQALEKIFKQLNKAPIEMIRVKEERFKEMGLNPKDQKTLHQWAKILSENPVLMERPLVIKGKKAALGRPPEAVLEIL
ncbi:MAG: arsenate reductase (glutaredoxin) [Deltaproteobacteria bacterium]|nr:arsenate reductase (glutaredoxin) [Deltaproteobacteria bacterium]